MMVDDVLAAWLCLDEQDDAEALEDWLVRAFRHAGLTVPDDPPGAGERNARHRLWSLMEAVEARRVPCVLALDELERLSDRHAVAIVNLLLERGPGNLKLAIACRDLPDGLRVENALFLGEAELLTVDQLRFTKAEADAFLGGQVADGGSPGTGEELQGWPIALDARRREAEGSGNPLAGRGLARKWLDARLWRSMTDADRELVLDAALLDPIESGLLDEVVDARGSWQRLLTLPAVDGLLRAVPESSPSVRRMHPLLRECCIERHCRLSPERFCEIHRRIARALARRGAVVAAMRHASEGNDPDLAATILEDAGGVRLAIREGHSRLEAAARYLTPAVLDRYPRLALAHCLILTMTGRQEEAARVYARIDGLSGDGARVDDVAQQELLVDDLFVRGVGLMLRTPTWSAREIKALRAQLTDVAQRVEIDPVMRAMFEYGLCILYAMRAEFDDALECADRARGALGTRWSYLPMILDYQVGAIAMVRGQVQDAAEWYGRAEHSLEADDRSDLGPLKAGQCLFRELELERQGVTVPGETPVVPSPFESGFSPFQVYAAASATLVEMTLRTQGPDAALEALRRMQDRTRRADLPAISRYLSILQASTLAGAGRIEECERVWRLASLPRDDAACLDLEGQTWREMEAVAEARLKLLRARRDFEAARTFYGAVTERVAERGLRRPQMRCLALAMAIEVAAGDRHAAAAHLDEYMRLCASTEYTLGLVREREVALGLLDAYLEGDADPALVRLATEVRSKLQDPDLRPAGVRLTARQQFILRRLHRQRDEDIAAALGITHAGVRYHVRKIFRALNARGRMDAVHRARRLGLLPD
ncbi:MAG: hypothetical protein F4X99_07040 [Gammaproteobacteria bacterium]|nr:hypothetical protein [Gammaproteobacteria bacterium]